MVQDELVQVWKDLDGCIHSYNMDERVPVVVKRIYIYIPEMD